MPEPSLHELILEVLADVIPEADLASLDPNVNLRDQVEMDSVDFLNFVLSLERRAGRRIPEVDYPKLSSLHGCEEYLAAHD